MGVKSGLGWYVSWAQGWAEYGKVFAALVMLWNAGAWAQFTLTLQPNTIPSGTNGAAYSQLITAVGFLSLVSFISGHAQ